MPFIHGLKKVSLFQWKQLLTVLWVIVLCIQYLLLAIAYNDHLSSLDPAITIAENVFLLIIALIILISLVMSYQARHWTFFTVEEKWLPDRKIYRAILRGVDGYTVYIENEERHPVQKEIIRRKVDPYRYGFHTPLSRTQEQEQQ